MSVSVLLKNAASSVGEGPHWDAENKCLYHVDINAGDVHKWDSRTGENTKVHFDDYVGFVIPRQSGGSIIGLGKTISHFNWGSNEYKVLAEVDQGKETRLNDAKCDSSGRLWCGTMTSGSQEGSVPNIGSLFSVEKDHSVRTHLPGVYYSNGIAWNKDNTVMFYNDTIPRKIYVFDFDIDSGTISNQRTVIDLKDNGKSMPDGMCMDSEDRLWVACALESKVARFDTETGKEIQNVKFPTSVITSCCFGGENVDELFVTSIARAGNLAPIDNEPLAGSLFRVTGLSVKGPPAPAFQG